MEIPEGSVDYEEIINDSMINTMTLNTVFCHIRSVKQYLHLYCMIRT